jgi:hypothetical protein
MFRYPSATMSLRVAACFLIGASLAPTFVEIFAPHEEKRQHDKAPTVSLPPALEEGLHAPESDFAQPVMAREVAGAIPTGLMPWIPDPQRPMPMRSSGPSRASLAAQAASDAGWMPPLPRLLPWAPT